MGRRTFGGGLALVSFWVALVGCGSQPATAERLHFQVIDSLLGPAEVLESARLSYRPPTGFLAVPDSVVPMIREQLSVIMPIRTGIRLEKVFLDKNHGAGFMLSAVPGVRRTGDTASFMAGYRKSLATRHQSAKIESGDFWIDSVYVKNFLITDSVFVRFVMVCLSPDGEAAELEYVTPGMFYRGLLKSFESSMGTVKALQPGG